MRNIFRRSRVIWAVLAGTCLVTAGLHTQLPRSAVGMTGTASLTASAAGPSSDHPHTVTLVTGDRVTVLGGDRVASFRPAAGRERIGRATFLVDGHLHVVPEDVQPLIAAGRVDRRLFDVSGLIEAGYNDDRTAQLPLMVEYDRRGSGLTRSTLAQLGITVGRTLSSVGMVSARPAKATTARTWPRLRSGTGVKKIWLDGKRKPALDQSVPQIGTPQAWQQGLTGQGVTVAVLDTGVDSTHPDLDGTIAEAVDFLGSGEPGRDRVGHGTHVASTIAGSGQASSGRLRGVAPDARLISGTVCELDACPESAILAGMEWAAVTAHADVINLSLGGEDTADTDPLEAAIASLTAQTGALFVVAAGNDGSNGPGTVGSPASADAALAVGAVNKADDLAGFSGRGPRIGDGGLKPDITAPGVGIVAARSADAVIGEPVGGEYLSLSGTSMAAPHVAGAAALLVQRHPDWTPTQLKSALMASARPRPEVSTFDQGAGRVDVARAIEQAVVTEPASLSFGTVRWPHHDDQPIIRSLTYRNLGATAVDLTLGSEFVGPDGQPAPADSVTLSADRLTLQPGASAAVTVTLSTNNQGPDGLYSGRVVATAGDRSTATPFGVNKEKESYDLTIRHLDSTGGVTPNGMTQVFGIGNSVRELFLTAADGTVELRLPKGRYAIDSKIGTKGSSDTYRIVRPNLVLDREVTVDADPRLTRPLTVTLENQAAQPRSASLDLAVQTAPGVRDQYGTMHIGDLARVRTASVGEPASAGEVDAYLSSLWAVPGPDGTIAGTPTTYHLMSSERGRFFTGLDRSVRDRDLAKVTARHNSQRAGATAFKLEFGFLPGPAFTTAEGIPLRLPSTRTHYLEAGDARWRGGLEEIADGELWPHTTLRSPRELAYRPGAAYHERWNAAVFGPGFSTFDRALRSGDRLDVTVPLYSDQDGHTGISATDSGRAQLYRDGRLQAESDSPTSLQADLPPGEAGYELRTTAERPSYSTLSTRTTVSWSFRSATTSGHEALPLWAVRFRPKVDARNEAESTPVVTLPFRVELTPGAKAGTIRVPTVRISGDDGTTWRPARVVRTGPADYLAVAATPAGATHLSISAAAADTAGNSVDQTIIRAYALKAAGR